jgi:hypothetical protein
MNKPDFAEVARDWLVRAQGHARAPHEQSLAVELEKVFERGREHERERVNAELQALVAGAGGRDPKH